MSREPAWTAAEFHGRRAALAWLAGQLGRAAPQNVNIVGEPRIGKTSLLHAVYRDRLGLPAGWTGVYAWLRLVEWPERSSAVFWGQLLDRVAGAAAGAGLEAVAERPSTGGRSSARLRRGPAQDAVAAAGARQSYQALEHVLERLEAARPGVRVIVLIDDFELLIPGLTGQDLDWLRALAVRFAALFALAIASTDPLGQLCQPLSAGQVSPLANIFQTCHLGLLTEPESHGLIEAAAQAEGQPAVPPELAEFLLHEAGRHPDLLKLACARLFEALAQDGATAGPDELVDAVRSDFRYDAHVRWLCERLRARRSDEEAAILAGLAAGTVSGDPILLRRLERQLDLVERRGERLAPFADAFGYWLARPAAAAAAADAPAGGPPVLVAGAPTVGGPAYRYDPARREVRVGERTSTLSALEDRLFQYLLGKPDQVCTTQELLAAVWGAGRTPSVVEKTVNRLRSKVEEDAARPRVILSARGEGYVLRAPDKE